MHSVAFIQALRQVVPVQTSLITRIPEPITSTLVTTQVVSSSSTLPSTTVAHRVADTKVKTGALVALGLACLG